MRRRIPVRTVERPRPTERHERFHVIAQLGCPGGGLSPPTAAATTTAPPPPATTAAAATPSATEPLAAPEPPAGPQSPHDAELPGPPARGRPSLRRFRAGPPPPATSNRSRRQRPQLGPVIARIVSFQLSAASSRPVVSSATASRSFDRSAVHQFRLVNDPPAIGGRHDDGRRRK